MLKEVILVIILGYVSAKYENKICLPVFKMDDNVSNVPYLESSSGTMGNIKEMFESISKRLNSPCKLNRKDLATKADLEDIKNNINELSSLIVKKYKQKPIDCNDIRNDGFKETGIYTIYPFGNEKGISVRCDMDTSGGGWTVIQRRISESDFYKNWTEYVSGFGNLTGNFYMGNRFLHHFSKQDGYMLRIDLTSFEEESAYAEYSEFWIGNAESRYTIHVGGYTGTAGDSLTVHNEVKFSTYDQDNDTYTGNCAKSYYGAWWYKGCHKSNLNGKYASKEFGKGTNWYTWKGYQTSMKTMEMKLRRKYN